LTSRSIANREVQINKIIEQYQILAATILDKDSASSAKDSELLEDFPAIDFPGRFPAQGFVRQLATTRIRPDQAARTRKIFPHA
jgi:hypothetical protein